MNSLDPSTLVIRRMTVEDIPAVHEIDTLSFSLPWPERSFRFEMTENPVSRGWVAEQAGQIIAMLILWLAADEAHIATIATHPNYRRQGLGEKILLVALGVARQEGARRAFLEVRAGNLAAQAMYHKYGFAVTGRRPRYYRDNAEDAILMALDELDRIGGSMNAEETLAMIAKEVSVCEKCVLHRSRKLSVPGEGPAHAEIMCIGEGPGFHENEQGRPFVGAAGNFLTELLAQAGMKREEVWIGNVVKCRPPGNRDPLPEELTACNEYLERQIAAIDPKIIITLGRFSMSKYMPGAKISAVHGQMRRIGDRFVIAMFHPAAALHQASLKPVIMKDFAQLPGLLEQANSALKHSAPVLADEKAQDDPKQLSMF
ncbi:MAG: ribosomal protein S18-alanine N-acetyltransferase [Anaerolineales bacterium]|nr:ribosomal protein S18-alanine N-acetyltransferase [Anaerolineales bacterium]